MTSWMIVWGTFALIGIVGYVRSTRRRDPLERWREQQRAFDQVTRSQR